jgi:hypothetical protein
MQAIFAGICRNPRLAGDAELKGRVRRAATSKKTTVAFILKFLSWLPASDSRLIEEDTELWKEKREKSRLTKKIGGVGL